MFVNIGENYLFAEYPNDHANGTHEGEGEMIRHLVWLQLLLPSWDISNNKT